MWECICITPPLCVVFVSIRISSSPRSCLIVSNALLRKRKSKDKKQKQTHKQASVHCHRFTNADPIGQFASKKNPFLSIFHHWRLTIIHFSICSYRWTCASYIAFDLLNNVQSCILRKNIVKLQKMGIVVVVVVVVAVSSFSLFISLLACCHSHIFSEIITLHKIANWFVRVCMRVRARFFFFWTFI